MDYVDDELRSEFVFNNPNAKVLYNKNNYRVFVVVEKVFTFDCIFFKHICKAISFHKNLKLYQDLCIVILYFLHNSFQASIHHFFFTILLETR